MPEFKASIDVLKELREVHSGLQTAMDALMKHYDPAEAGRILILVDSRLTSLVNRIAPESVAAIPGAKHAPIANPAVWTMETLQRFYDRSGVPALLAETSRQSGRRVSMRRVDGGLDLVVEGLSEPLGTVRLATSGLTKVVYAPRVGLRAFKIEPDPLEFERWAQSIIDVWHTAMTNVEQRRRHPEHEDDERVSGEETN